MKHAITIAAILMANTAAADGPTPGTYDPPVIPPYQSAWVGAYAGLSLNVMQSREARTETVEEYKECEPIGKPGTHYGNKCWVPGTGVTDLPRMKWRECDHSDNAACIIATRGGGDTGRPVEHLLWLNEGPIEYVSGFIDVLTEYTDTDTGFGAFAGYGWDLDGQAIIRAELAHTDGLTVAEAHLGYDMAAYLPYLSAGVAYDGDDTGLALGVGVDYMTGFGALIGADVTAMPDLDALAGSVRVGWAW